MKPAICNMPEPVRRSEAEIYRSIRDRMIRSHCDRKAAAHKCCGAITITRSEITLSCRLCGDARSLMPSAE